MYLPIAAEAEAAASRAAAELPASAGQRHDSPQNLPAPAQPGGAPSIPSIPDATAHLGKAAARWIRPLVPPLVGRVIDNTTQPLTKPLRTARQVFEDVEEIAFSFKRTRKITVNTESSDVGEQPQTAAAAPGDISRIESSRGEPHRTFQRPEQRHEPARLPEAPRNDLASLSAGGPSGPPIASSRDAMGHASCVRPRVRANCRPRTSYRQHGPRMGSAFPRITRIRASGNDRAGSLVVFRSAIVTPVGA